ncbi:unnamed protein product [Anisakis simplex]|uniref:5-hydroxytryptamine receptor 6 (inferred by orthology to a human protein) n=1 Tax=Anisakis simplex TaxID=6269 RepID=A0A158PMU0_ANISI|nr:unnamed protein product [Anisakis simplex]
MSNSSRLTRDALVAVSVVKQHVKTFTDNQHSSALQAQFASQSSAFKLCLGLQDVFVALFLVLLIFATIFGNILVVLSVFVYQRMRTFTNILLTSLATADLLVGLVVMPLSLLDLLHSHNWPLGRIWCGAWATTDVLLCTASILNLCIISLDRYMAITSPLKYPRTRSSLFYPPWFVPDWGHFTQYTNDDLKTANSTSSLSTSTTSRHSFACVYSPSIPYRIYSALGSFYIPLLVMLSVYFKIFRVTSEREALMRQTLGTCRLSKRDTKTKRKNRLLINDNHRNNLKYANAQSWSHINLSDDNVRNYSTQYNSSTKRDEQIALVKYDSRFDLIDYDEATLGQDERDSTLSATLINADSDGRSLYRSTLYRQHLASHSMADLAGPKMHAPAVRNNTETNVVPVLTKTAQLCHNRLQPINLLDKAQDHYHTYGPGKITRGSKEKMVYLRERKALKTIGIVVLGKF